MIIRIADINIKVEPQYFRGEEFFQGYVKEETSYDIEVEITEADMEEERRVSVVHDGLTLAILEKTAIFRKICLEMLAYQAFFLHSSVVVVDHKAYAFAAKSGTGKSTHTNLWLEHFQEDAYIVNGDKPLYRYIGDNLYVCGHPWAGKENLHRNAMVPLCGVSFLQRGERNGIRRLDSDEVIAHIFRQILLPQEEDLMVQLLEMMDRFVQEVPCYLLTCNISMEAVKVAYEGMKSEEGIGV